MRRARLSQKCSRRRRRAQEHKVDVLFLTKTPWVILVLPADVDTITQERFQPRLEEKAGSMHHQVLMHT